MPATPSAAHATPRASTSWAALNTVRNGALRLAIPAISVEVTLSTAATGRPQYSSAAKLNVTEATPESEPDLPGVMIGRNSASMIMTAIVHSSGLRTRECSSADRKLAMAAHSTAKPATEITVKWIQSGDPARGVMSLVSFGSFIYALVSRPARADAHAKDSTETTTS